MLVVLEGQALVVSGTSKCVLLLLLHWDVVPHEYIVSDIYRSSHMNMNALGLVSSYDRKRRRENHHAGELPCTLQMTHMLLLFRSLENCESVDTVLLCILCTESAEAFPIVLYL